MWTAAERLQFIVRFAQMQLDALRPGDWLNIRDDFHAFWRQRETAAEPGGIMAQPLQHPSPQEYTEADFRALQTEVYGILNGFVCERESPGFSLQLAEIHAQFGILNVGARDIPGGWTLLQALGHTRDMFLLIFFFLLSRQPTDRILRCPECHTIFCRIRKQKYCTRACSNRATVRQWRQSATVKQAEAERAHQRYVKKKRPAIGPHTQVTRRPRPGKRSQAETPRES
jgi:hypothetical protein